MERPPKPGKPEEAHEPNLKNRKEQSIVQETRKASIDKKESVVSERIGVVHNRPVGKRTERAVFNTEELKNKEYLTYEDAKEFIDKDSKEIQAIAAELSNKLGSSITEDAARKILHTRMQDLYKLTVQANQERERKREDIVNRFVNEKKNLERQIDNCWPWQISKKREFNHRIQLLHQQHQERLNEFSKLASFESGGKTYYLDVTTHIALNGMRAGRDAVLLFKSDGKNRALRLNTIQMELAERGAYYKGEPSDNTYDYKNKNWDQAAYPQSPLKFYQEHVQEWLDSNPDEARYMLQSIERKE